MSIASVLANEQRWHVEVGHVIDGLRKCPAGIFQSIVTSPPYWGLRSYLPSDHPDKSIEIGSEPTPSEFVMRMVEIFRECRRVLRDDGTLFVNLGDNYAQDKKWGGQTGGKHAKGLHGTTGIGRNRTHTGLQPGGQVLMPHRVAMAMQDDGWNLRSTIVWAKRNPMCESLQGWRWQRCRVKIGRVAAPQGGLSSWDMGEHSHGPSTGEYRGQEKTVPTYRDCSGCDKCRPNGGYVFRPGSWRPTTSHEYVFMFTKGGRYFCDGDAAKEPVADANRKGSGNKERFIANGTERSRVNNHLGSAVPWENNGSRNPRSVWMFSSEPERAKHFATFPSALPRKCLTAATSPAGCCPACGASYAPVVESERVPTRPGDSTKTAGKNSGMYRSHDPAHANEEYDAERLSQDRLEIGNRDPQRHIAVTRVTGYRPTCACDAGDPVPSLVCDIFSGSGTTGRVAFDMGLRYIGFELSEEYAAISREKIVRPFKKAATKKQRRPMKSQRSLWEVV